MEFNTTNSNDFVIENMYHVHPWWKENHWRSKYVPLIMEVKDKESIISVFEYDFHKPADYIDDSRYIDAAYVKKPNDPWDNPWRITSCDINFAAWYYMFNINPANDFREKMLPFSVTLNYDNNHLLLREMNDDFAWDMDEYVEQVVEQTIDFVPRAS